MRSSIILIVLSCLVLCLGAQCLGQSNSCGCSTSSAPEAGKTVTIQLTIDNIPRSYLLYVPKNYNPGDAIPLIVAFHGWTDTASGMAPGSGLTKTADAHGFAVAFPEGINYPAAGRGWAFPGCNSSPPVEQVDGFGRRAVCEIGNRYDCDSTTCPSDSALDQCAESALNSGLDGGLGCSPSQTNCVMDFNDNCNWCGCVDDEAFTRAVIKDVSDRLCIDLAQIHATGMSAGGMMTSWLIGQMHDVFAAYAPMSGTNPRDFYSLPPSDADISVMWIHGTRDSTVPHDGSLASDGYRYEAAEAEAQALAERLGCSSPEPSPYQWDQSFVQAPSQAELDCQYYDCTDDGLRRVAYCLWDGGHNYPKERGPRESTLWGNRLMVEFFLNHIKSDPAQDLCNTPPPPPASETGSIQGVVYLDGNRAKEIAVEAYSQESEGTLYATTSKSGKYTFTQVPVGSWTLQVDDPTCPSVSEVVEVTADSTVKQNLVITCP